MASASASESPRDKYNLSLTEIFGKVSEWPMPLRDAVDNAVADLMDIDEAKAVFYSARFFSVYEGFLMNDLDKAAIICAAKPLYQKLLAFFETWSQAPMKNYPVGLTQFNLARRERGLIEFKNCCWAARIATAADLTIMEAIINDEEPLKRTCRPRIEANSRFHDLPRFGQESSANTSQDRDSSVTIRPLNVTSDTSGAQLDEPSATPHVIATAPAPNDTHDDDTSSPPRDQGVPSLMSPFAWLKASARPRFFSKSRTNKVVKFDEPSTSSAEQVQQSDLFIAPPQQGSHSSTLPVTRAQSSSDDAEEESRPSATRSPSGFSLLSRLRGAKDSATTQAPQTAPFELEGSQIQAGAHTQIPNTPAQVSNTQSPPMVHSNFPVLPFPSPYMYKLTGRQFMSTATFNPSASFPHRTGTLRRSRGRRFLNFLRSGNSRDSEEGLLGSSEEIRRYSEEASSITTPTVEALIDLDDRGHVAQEIRQQTTPIVRRPVQGGAQQGQAPFFDFAQWEREHSTRLAGNMQSPPQEDESTHDSKP